MQEYSIDQIQERYEILPQEIREAVSSDEILEKIKSIGQKYNLLINEVGELVDQVVLVMMGLEKSSTFVNDIQQRTSITSDQAKALAADINVAVFDQIKTKMREAPMSDRASSVASIEKAGGFTIEHDEPKFGSMTNRPPLVGVMSIKPAPIEKPANMPTNLLGKTEVSHFNSEPLVDQLMRGTKPSIFESTPVTPPPAPKPIAVPPPPVITTPIIVPKIPDVTPKAPEHTVAEPPVNLPTSDSYREPVK